MRDAWRACTPKRDQLDDGIVPFDVRTCAVVTLLDRPRVHVRPWGYMLTWRALSDRGNGSSTNSG